MRNTSTISVFHKLTIERYYINVVIYPTELSINPAYNELLGLPTTVPLLGMYHGFSVFDVPLGYDQERDEVRHRGTTTLEYNPLLRTARPQEIKRFSEEGKAALEPIDVSIGGLRFSMITDEKSDRTHCQKIASVIGNVRASSIDPLKDPDDKEGNIDNRRQIPR